MLSLGIHMTMKVASTDEKYKANISGPCKIFSAMISAFI